MKKGLFTAVIWIAAVLFGLEAYGQYAGNITISNKEHFLSAPMASSYQWYFNGMRLSVNTREIRAISPGTYRVEMTRPDGTIETAGITVGFDNEGVLYTVYILGDSTASTWSSAFYPQAGWGQVLRFFFSPSVFIDNRALSARSAKSFYNDHWAPIREILKPGDYVFIQFGINDAKSDDTARYTEPFGTFQDYLTLFVEESQAKGAYPVLLTTVRRNAWYDTEPPTLYPSYHDYPVATRQLAGELGVPLIDIDQLAVPLLESLGPGYTGPFLYMSLDPGEYPAYPDGRSDQVHFQEMGAVEMARIVADAISTFDEDTVLNKLIPYIKPVFEVSVSANFPEGAVITRSAAYTEGTPVTIKARLDPDYDLLEWKDDNDSLISREDRFTFVMEARNLSYTAILDDDPVRDCSGEYNGTAYLDDCGDCVEGTTGLMPCCIDIPDDTFRITSVSTGLCVGESQIPGEENLFIGLTPWTGEKNQGWIFSREMNHYTVKNLGSNLYLDSDGNVTSSFLLAGRQLNYWRVEKYGMDTFQLIPVENTRLATDIYSNSPEYGLLLWLLGRKNLPVQRFTLQKEEAGAFLASKRIEKDGFAVYPNPFKDQIILMAGEKNESPFSFSLFDVQGKELARFENVRSGKFTISHPLPNGYYLIKIVMRDKVWSLGMIKTQ